MNKKSQEKENFKMKTSKIILILLMVLTIVFIGCSKKTTESEPPPANTATATIHLTTENIGGSVVGAVVSLTNNSGNMAHVYQSTAMGSAVVFSDVEFGIYTITVKHSLYHVYAYESLSIREPMVSKAIILTLDDNDPHFILLNKTGWSGTFHCYLKLPTEVEWNHSLLSANLSDGASSAVRFPLALSVANRYDFQFSSSANPNLLTGTNVSWWKFDYPVTNGKIVEFSERDRSKQITIKNMTGYALENVSIFRTAQTNAILITPMSMGQEASYYLNIPMSSTVRLDFHARTAIFLDPTPIQIFYRKLNLIVEDGGVYVLSEDDRG